MDPIETVILICTKLKPTLYCVSNLLFDDDAACFVLDQHQPDSAIIMHGHVWQLLVGPTGIGALC